MTVLRCLLLMLTSLLLLGLGACNAPRPAITLTTVDMYEEAAAHYKAAADLYRSAGIADLYSYQSKADRYAQFAEGVHAAGYVDTLSQIALSDATDAARIAKSAYNSALEEYHARR